MINNIITQCYVVARVNGMAIQNKLEKFTKDQRGVTAIEYALIGVAMATLLAAILGNQNEGFLGAINTAFVKIQAAIVSVTTAPAAGGGQG